MTKGLLEDGTWLCDCAPRKPAVCLTVKKDNSNKGKRFYKCDSKKCGFFIWESEANKRKQEALLKHNCASENGIVARVQAKGEEAPMPAVFKSKVTGGGSHSHSKKQQQQQTKGQEPVAATVDTLLPRRRLFTAQSPTKGAKAASVLSQDSEYLSWDSAGDDDDNDNDNEMAINEKDCTRSTKDFTSHNSLNSRNAGSSISSITLQSSPTSARSRTVPSTATGRPATTTTAPQTPSAKRKRTGFVIDEDSDEFGYDEFDEPALSQELARITEASARKLHSRDQGGAAAPAYACAETPTTGGKRFANLGGGGGGGGSSLPTPVTGGGRAHGTIGKEADEEYGNTAKKLRFNDNAQGGERTRGRGFELGKDPETPTPYRKTDAFAPATANTTRTSTLDITSATSLFTTPRKQPPPPPPPQQQQQSQTNTANAIQPATTTATTPATTVGTPDVDIRALSNEIKDLLSKSQIPLPESTRTHLDTILERYERRVRGLIKGRDAARTALEARDARIAEMQTRIAGLENARRMDRESLRDVRRGLLKLPQLSDDEHQQS
ncbi:hypothetical protein BD289DRAFT_504523 [Coniella lustricola]|uniref:GRF-type domain-containing protein n=1 Tax=Coniella lustricola TaxID=2025994 RepID=A0A2T3ADH6_9PEZI|nr:hypothetical protein BD289DRAFT_504523 [Coniella lustricola]